MKISEVVELLEAKRAQHGDVEVEVTWEGTRHGLDPSGFYLSKDGPLYIDADMNYYKSEFAVDPREGEG